jgi:hypothetical protein
VDCVRYTDCWSTGWGSEIFPDANIPTFYSDALRLVYQSFISKRISYFYFKVVSNEKRGDRVKANIGVMPPFKKSPYTKQHEYTVHCTLYTVQALSLRKQYHSEKSASFSTRRRGLAWTNEVNPKCRLLFKTDLLTDFSSCV